MSTRRTPRQPVQPKPRKPGRPPRATGTRAAGADQRSRLLDAAVLLFSRQGVNATSLQAVAREAGVTPALLHYYFGSREQLLDVLVQERLLPIVAGILQRAVQQGFVTPGAAGPRELIRALVPEVLRTVSQHAWLPPLWVREVLSDGGALRERVLVHAKMVAPLISARLAQAQAEGQLNPALEPRLLLVSIIGLTLFPLAAAPIWRQLFDADGVTVDTLVTHTLALLEQGIFPNGAGQ